MINEKQYVGAQHKIEEGFDHLNKMGKKHDGITLDAKELLKEPIKNVRIDGIKGNSSNNKHSILGHKIN
jgi:hypothetical protein